MSALASVLLLESDDDNRDMYAESLTFEGFRVLAADNGAEALRLVPTADVIVTAIRLRGSMDGVEFIEQVRASDLVKPILTVTGDASAADRRRAERAGANGFLVKPCLPDTLCCEIRRVLTSTPAAPRHG